MSSLNKFYKDSTDGVLCPCSTADPLPRFSVPVQFTPYNSLKVFDISKHTGPGVADVAGPWPQRQLLYQPVRSMGVCTDMVLRTAVLMPCGCSDRSTVQRLNLTPIIIMGDIKAHSSHCFYEAVQFC